MSRDATGRVRAEENRTPERPGLHGPGPRISRLLGLVRDIFFAALFPGGEFGAFAVPNVSRRLSGEGAFAGALVSALVKKIDKGDREGAGVLAAQSLEEPWQRASHNV